MPPGSGIFVLPANETMTLAGLLGLITEDPQLREALDKQGAVVKQAVTLPHRLPFARS